MKSLAALLLLVSMVHVTPVLAQVPAKPMLPSCDTVANPAACRANRAKLSRNPAMARFVNMQGPEATALRNEMSLNCKQGGDKAKCAAARSKLINIRRSRTAR